MVAWPEGVNQKAYGMSIDYEQNTVELEFDSGKKRTYLKNSSPKKEFSFNLKFDDTGAQSEFKKFLSWYDNVLLSGTQSFEFPNLITHNGTAEYKLTDTPSARGQKFKEVSLSVIEM